MWGTGISPRQTSSRAGRVRRVRTTLRSQRGGLPPLAHSSTAGAGRRPGQHDMDTRYRNRSLTSEGPVRLLKSQNQWHVPRSKYFRVTRRQVTCQPLFQICVGTQEAGLLGSVQREGPWVTGRWGCAVGLQSAPHPTPTQAAASEIRPC